MQMFLHVSCLSQTLSLPRQAILSLACFLIIASALKQTPLQGFSIPLSLLALSWTALCGLQAQGCAKRHAKGWQSSEEEGKAACYFRPLILPMSSVSSPLLMTWWLLGPPEPCISKVTIEVYSLCPTHINYWLFCGDRKKWIGSGESPISNDCSSNFEKVVHCTFLWTVVFLWKRKEAGHCCKIFEDDLYQIAV